MHQRVDRIGAIIASMLASKASPKDFMPWPVEDKKDGTLLTPENAKIFAQQKPTDRKFSKFAKQPNNVVKLNSESNKNNSLSKDERIKKLRKFSKNPGIIKR